MGWCCLIESFFQGAAIFGGASIADIGSLLQLRTDLRDKIRAMIITQSAERALAVSGEIRA